jgi:NADH-quinone oxidoreductase subunit J
MTYAFYIAAALGAVGLYLILPHGKATPAKIGGAIGLLTLGGLLTFLLQNLPAESRPGWYYFVFTAISVIGSVRVISHPRPVYSALYFVLVILATAGLLVILQAEFMAFAMVIIYAGAILVTYMFVIMLATMPQSAKQGETSPYYDRSAREPFLSALMGMLLVAVIGSVVFNQPADRIQRNFPQPASSAAVVDMPRKLNRERLVNALRRNGTIGLNETIADQGDIDLVKSVVYMSRVDSGARAREVALTPELLGQFVANIDYVGLNLFKGHTLGIELAGVILLLSMVGAIVIARRPVPEAESSPELESHTTHPQPVRSHMAAGHH